MSTLVAITISGIALGAVYFLVASGLSLIYGLMDVLNFAHGMFLTLGGFAGWVVSSHLPSGLTHSGFGFVVTVVASVLAGGLVAGLTELLLIRPLYGRPISQILVTIGLDLAAFGLLLGVYGGQSRAIAVPSWLTGTSVIGPERIPNGDFVAIGAGVVVILALFWFLRRTRYGIIIQAGAENREMVRALGIDVGRAFTLVFVIGGAAAGFAGLLNAIVFNATYIDPSQGDQMLIFAFIVVVIGGLGSLPGCAGAALLVGLAQVYIDYYAGDTAGLGQLANLSVVLVLVAVLLVKPQGLLGRATT